MTIEKIQKTTSGTLKKLPAFVDMHVHLRQPGFEHKETIMSGSLAAKAGGFSHILCMPNTKPVIDSAEMVALIKAQPAAVSVLPIGSITIGQHGKELTDFAKMKAAGAVAFSDDGVPVESSEIMKQAMYKAVENDVLLISHCENRSLIPSKLQSPPEAEYTAIERECRLALETGARLHIAHISTKESVEIIAAAKKHGAAVTCETCPHYFSLTRADFEKTGTNAMMNPPLRDESDVKAIIKGIQNRVIDVISTDHAPHSIAEKAQSPELAPFGIIGLETSFCVSYTYLVKTGLITLDRLIELMSTRPREIAKLHSSATVLADLETEFVYDVSASHSLSRNSPYDKQKFYGKIITTILEDK